FLLATRTTEDVSEIQRALEMRDDRKFLWNGDWYGASHPVYVAKLSADGERQIIRTKTTQRNYEFPVQSAMSNVAVLDDRACCFSGVDQLWTLDLRTLSWSEIPFAGSVNSAPQPEPLSSNEKCVVTANEASNTLELVQFSPDASACTRLLISVFRLTPAPPRETARGASGRPPSATFSVRVGTSRAGESTGLGVHTASGIPPAAKLEEISKLREDDGKIENLSLLYTRRCGVCFNENPLRRVSFTACGHLSCQACAVEMANSSCRFQCPFCRANTQFVKIFEETKEKLEADSNNN
ncbi:hypothetical protein PFISCL1PPCAC_12989, partial [Pristionchus fissidentatus]